MLDNTSFSDQQKKELAKPLDKAVVKPPAPGKYGDYIEGWHVIAEANRIFGFDGWTRETVDMIETNRDLLDLKGRDGSTYQQWRVGFRAKVRILAGGISREGTGFGSGAAKPEQLGEAIESAIKEAETDAMKRALMTFGNPFGLALYDKSHANVQSLPTTITDDQRAQLATLAEVHGVTLLAVCEMAKISDLRELDAQYFESAKKWIGKHKKAA